MTTPEKKLPNGWQWVKLGDVCRVFAGSAAPQGKDYFSDDGPFFFRVSDLSRIAQNVYLSQANDRLSEEALQKLSLTPAKKGTVVFPKSGAAIALNNRGILDVDGYIVSHLMALEPTDATISRWIYYATLKIDMMEFANNSGYPSLRQSTVESISIPLPPLAEQQRIVAALEAQLAVVERARNAAEEILEAVKALSENLPRKFLPLGQKLPHSWQWARLGDVCKFEYGASLPARDRILGKYKVLGSNGQIGTHIKPLTSGPTITIGRKGSVGEVNYVPEPCWPIDTTYFIEEHFTSENLEWLYVILKTLQLGKLDKSTAIPGLNRNDAYNLSIPVPPLSEQRRIVAALEQQMAAADRAKQAADEALNKLRELPGALLRRAFAGEV